MKAFEIVEPGVCRMAQVDPIEPRAGEVLLRVHTVGLCGSDLNTFRGRNPLVGYPRIPGHEVAGSIAAVGAGVAGWSVGEHVLVFPYTNCGRCTACDAGRPNCCQHNQTLGVQRDGAMVEYVSLPADKILRAEGLSPTELALVEPLTVGFHAAARGNGEAGDTVLVFGAGAIGLGAIAGAAFRGGRVIAVDIDDAKLDLATRCGALGTINSRRESLHRRVQELTDGRGANISIEAVGLPETFVAAVEEVCFAGTVVYIGYSSTPVTYDTKQFVMKEVDIRGSRNALASDFESVIRMLQQRKFPAGAVVSHHGPIEQAGDLLRAWADSPSAFTKIHVQVSLDSP